MSHATNTASVPDRGADADVVETRGYASPLRARQTELTRELILRATAAAITDDPLFGFSMQEVADRAGVSLRSVYRHYPGRKQLFEALYDWSSSRLEVPALIGSVRSLEDLPSLAAPLFTRFESESPIARAGVLASLALGTQPAMRAEWDKTAGALFRAALPNLDADEKRRAWAMVRLLFTSRVWLTLSDRFGLDTTSAADAVEWAAQALIEELKRQNDDRGATPKGIKTVTTTRQQLRRK
jgi:AcrR family transcriptional regulator